MSTIHMKTEHVEEVAFKMNWVDLQMSTKPGKLKGLANALSGAWQGGQAAQFAGELLQASNIVERQNSDFQRLMTRLRNEVNQWIDVDNAGASRLAEIGVETTGPLPLSMGTSNASPSTQSSSVPSTSQAASQGFDWLSWSGSLVSVVGEAGKALPKVGKVFEGSIASMGFSVVGVGFNIWEDREQGESWSKSIGSSLITGAISLAPPVAVYELGLAGADLIAGTEDLVGLHQLAHTTQDLVTKLEFPEKLGDAYYDFISAHPSSALESVAFPEGAWLNPDYVRFAGSFAANNLKDFGLQGAATWVQNNTETIASLESASYGILSTGVRDFVQSWIH